jgi:hypothetical protein
MAERYEKCGCDESKYLRLAIREYMENNDDTGLRCEYGAPPQLNTIEKLRHVDMPLSIEDRRQIYAEIERLRKRDIPMGSKLTDVIKTARIGAAREAFDAVAEVAKLCHLTLDQKWIEEWLAAQKPGW